MNITKYQIGLVFRKGEYVKCLTEGSYWIGWNQNVIVYDMTKPFYTNFELNIFLQDETLAKYINLVEVADNEIAIQYTNGNYTNVLKPGRYAFWNSVVDYKFDIYDTNELEVPKSMSNTLFKVSAIKTLMNIFEVSATEKAILIVDGDYVKVLGPGIYRYWRNAKDVKVLKTDLRQKQIEISGQELLTKDKAALRMNVFAQYKVTDIQTALMDNKDYEKQLYVAVQFALREFVGALSFDELLTSKEAIATYALQEVRQKAKIFGVELIGFGVKDIILPGDMKEIMNQVLIAQKQAQANTILRREETAATRSLLNTAKLMEDNAMLLKLKEMEYVEKIADKIGEITVTGNSQIVDQLTEIFVGK